MNVEFNVELNVKLNADLNVECNVETNNELSADLDELSWIGCRINVELNDIREFERDIRNVEGDLFECDSIVGGWGGQCVSIPNRE